MIKVPKHGTSGGPAAGFPHLDQAAPAGATAPVPAAPAAATATAAAPATAAASATGTGPDPTASVAALPRLALLALMWGVSFLFIKVALEGLAPAQIVLGRLLAGGAVLGGIVALRREPLPRRPVLWAHLLAMGVLGNVVPFFLFAWGEQRASSSLAGIYNATTPLLTLLVAIVALPQERPNAARAAGLGLGFLGVLVVLAPWRGVGAAGFTGQAAFVAAAACYGVSFVYTRRFLSGSGYSPLALSAGQIGGAAAVLVLLTPFVALTPVSLPPRVVASVLALGAFGTGLAYLIYYGLIRDVGATTASTVTYLTPLVAVALGVAVLGDQVYWNHVVGAAVVVLGVAVAEGRIRLRPVRE
jgi:drug/metabolite transporter (DMT)-like permease